MKLERLPEYLTTATAVALGGLISWWFGTLAGEGKIGTILALILGACFLAVLLSFRQNVWVLIPVCSGIFGGLPLAPLKPGFLDVVIMSVLGTTFLLIAVKAIRFRPRFTTIDFFLWAMMLYVALTWLRHPTGGYILSSDRIGGRAYLNTAIMLGSYFALSRASIPASWNPVWLAFCTVSVAMLQGLLVVFTHFLPGVGARVGMYFTGVDATAFASSEGPGAGVDPMAESVERSSYLQFLVVPIIKWLLAWVRPLSLLNPLQFISGPLQFIRNTLFCLALLGTLMGGYRSGVIGIMGTFLVASHLRRGLVEVARVGGLICLAALLLVGLSYVVTLPDAIQRSLTTLPGNWKDSVKADAAHSAEWRFVMWRLMLTSDRYIENKWLGDGFGFTAQQFQAMTSNLGTLQAQENFMITGQVHSGPISTIRFVGYVGLAVWMALMIATAREAFKLCRATMGTPLHVFTWYFCLPMIWEPFSYVVIFGSFDNALPQQVYWVGLLKMLRNSVEARTVAQEEKEEERSPRREFRQVRRPALTGVRGMARS